MKWLSTTADEHVLCDDRGRSTKYRVMRDPVTCVYTAYVGLVKQVNTGRLAIGPAKLWCERQYAKSKRESAA